MESCVEYSYVWFSRDLTTVMIILSMLLVSGILRFIQEMRAKRTADHLTSLLYSTVTVRRDGEWKEISSSDLVVGDVVRLFAGNQRFFSLYSNPHLF